jgi:hypothetical protein
MRLLSFAVIAFTLLAFVATGRLHADDEPAATPIPVDADQTLLDRTTDYRYDPVGRQLWPIPRESLLHDCIYLTYAADLDAWTWSQWTGATGFQFAMGPGSIQPGERFHLTITDAEGLRVLEARAPELARKFEIQGTKPVLRLDDDGNWRVNPTSCGARVFDTRTGERWEWHGPKQAGVTHFSGNRWQYDNGRYVPRYR